MEIYRDTESNKKHNIVDKLRDLIEVEKKRLEQILDTYGIEKIRDLRNMLDQSFTDSMRDFEKEVRAIELQYGDIPELRDESLKSAERTLTQRVNSVKSIVEDSIKEIERLSGKS